MAPELIQKQDVANAKVDMWSLGIILYKILFHNKYPFLDSNESYDIGKAFKDIIANKLHIPSKIKRDE